MQRPDLEYRKYVSRIASKLSANAYDNNALVWEHKGKANNNVELTVAFE